MYFEVLTSFHLLDNQRLNIFNDLGRRNVAKNIKIMLVWVVSRLRPKKQSNEKHGD